MDRARGRRSSPEDDEPSSSRGQQSKRRRSDSIDSQAPHSKRGERRRDEDGRRGDGGERRERKPPKVDLIHTMPDHINRRGNKCGENGKELFLISNYFPLQTRAHWKLFAYHCTFDPELDVRSFKNRLLKDFGEGLIPEKHFFDGSVMRCASRMKNDLTYLEGETKEGLHVKITIKYVKEESNLDPTFHQHLNLILRLAMKQLKLKQVGRHLYDPIAAKNIPELKLELWPGYSTSIRLHDGGLLMNADVITKVMRKETLLQILNSMSRLHDYQQSYSKEVIGSIVLTDYNNQTYQILDISWDQTPQSTFETKAGPETYVDYYYKKYQIKIRDLNQPLLIARPKEKRKQQMTTPDFIALIPELCRATGLSESQRTDNRLMRNVADATRLDAPSRAQRLRDFNRRLRTTDESVKIFKDWQMNLNPDLVVIPARVMSPEIIIFQHDRVESRNADWTSQLRGQTFHASGSLPRGKWYVVVPTNCYRDTNNFVRMLQKAVNNMGFVIDNPIYKEISNDNAGTILDELSDILNTDPTMIMVILNNGSADRYAAIKKKTCVDHHTPTQVILSKTFRNKGLMSVATKVGIQMNSKLGFNSWFIKLPLSELMIIGYDVTHDTRNKKLSYGAMVASIHKNKDSCTYFSTAMPHSNGNEMSDTMWLMLMGALRQYRDINGSLPNKIIFYRDGVGEGQLQMVYEYELKSVLCNLEELYDKYNAQLRSRGEPEVKLRFAFIVVNKRVNTRFFQEHDSRNPPCGTVVDKMVTLPERYDFFLVSQHVRQGTVSPTAYNVIHDTIELPPEKLQILTYKCCHLYYNWSGTVRVPAVVQYAKKLAFLCGQYLHKTPNPKISGRKLYFL